MLSVLAFSLQDQIQKYGAYVAVACFIGLALLSILYFAQARELRRLRDWAGRAPERDAELEARVSARADAARHATIPALAPRPAAATRAATLAQETQITAPPVPAGENGHGPGEALTVPMGPRPASAAVAVAAAVAAAQAPAAAATQAPGTPAPQETAEADAVTDGAGNGQLPPEESSRAVADAERPAEIPRATPRPTPAPAPAAPRRPAQAVRSAERSATVPPRRQPAPAARRSRSAPTPTPPPARGGHRALVVAVVAGLVVIAAAALAITQLGGKGAQPTAPNTTAPQPTSTTGATTGTPAGGPAKADTTVVILNGTSTEGLAAKAKDTLQNTGYTNDRMPTSNATNQATARSTVYYAHGRKRQALDVARALDINAVQASTPDVQSLADNSSDPPVKSDVVVILGADRTP